MPSVRLPEGFVGGILPVLSQNGVNSVYLFGSRVDGTASTDSDYDLGILLRHFDQEKHDTLFACELETDLRQAARAPIDVVLLQRAPVILKYTIIAEGQIIYCVNSDYRTDFEDIVVRDYLDFRPFLDMYYRDMYQSIRGGAS
ncbi:MAG: nucleotidyltransferase domain-containing protein [Firmicutes bacterium]|nr:nucleotidyltransferase domain-containing protein [Bacillota bacterium]